MPGRTRCGSRPSRATPYDVGPDGEGMEMLTPEMRVRNTVLAVIGVVALLLKASYTGPFEEVVHSYAGNFVVSFALYFAAVSGTQRFRRPRLAATLMVLLAVTLFEITDGFGFMSNVYDPVDLFANTAGVGFARATEVLMAQIKTHSTADSVRVLIDQINDEGRRADCLALLELMKRATGVEPAVWSSGVIGFGTFHYKSSSGQEGDWFPVGFASRKAAITVYLGVSLDGLSELLSRLGKHTSGKGCIYIKRLADVDLAVLEALVAEAYAGVKRTYG